LEGGFRLARRPTGARGPLREGTERRVPELGAGIVAASEGSGSRVISPALEECMVLLLSGAAMWALIRAIRVVGEKKCFRVVVLTQGWCEKVTALPARSR
jgi:hypothetical protein